MSKFSVTVLQSIRANAQFCSEYLVDEPSVSDFRAYSYWLKQRIHELERGTIATDTLVADLLTIGSFHSHLEHTRRFDDFFVREDQVVKIKAPATSMRALESLVVQYTQWLDAERDFLSYAQAEGRVQKALGHDERVALQRMLVAARSSRSKARGAKLDYETRKRDKTELKLEVLDFLRWKRFMGLRGLSTQTLKVKLGKEMIGLHDLRLRWYAHIRKIREESEGLVREIETEELEREAYRRKVARIRWIDRRMRKGVREVRAISARIGDADALMDELDSAKAAKASAADKAKTATKVAKALTTQVEKRVAAHGRLVAKGVSAVSEKGVVLAKDKRKIKSTREQLAAIIEEVPLAHRRLALAQTRLDSIAGIVAELAGQVMTKRRLEDSGLAIYEAMLEEASKQFDARKAERDLAQEELTRVTQEHERLARATIRRAERHTAKLAVIIEEENAALELEIESKLGKQELGRLQRMSRTAVAINVYCSFYDFTFPKLLAFGNLVAGDAPKTKVGKLGWALAGTPAKVTAMGTGSLALSISFGLAYGGSTGGWALEAGLALKVSLGINVQDDRRFRAATTWSLIASATAKIPKIFTASIEATLFKTKRVFVFQDQYHWAAWLAQQWARAIAVVRACESKAFGDRSRYDKTPTKAELEEILEIADHVMLEDSRLRAVLEELSVYLKYNVVEVTSTQLFAGVEAGVDLADGSFGLSGAVARTSKPNFQRYRMASGEHVLDIYRRPRLEALNATIKGASLTVTAFNVGVTFAYSNIDNHANPDNDGKYLNIQIAIPGLSSIGVTGSTPSQAPDLDNFLVDWSDTLSDLAPGWDKLASALGGPAVKLASEGTLKKFAITAGIATIEINLVYDDDHSRWLLQYWRALAGRETSAKWSFPTAAPGLAVTLGASYKISRSYWEHLGTGTLSYIQTVYNGFMNRPAQTRVVVDGDTSTARPDELSADLLWARYLEYHAAGVRKILVAIGRMEKTARHRTGSSLWGEIDSALASALTLRTLCKKLYRRQSKAPKKGRADPHFASACEALTDYFKDARAKLGAAQPPRWSLVDSSDQVHEIRVVKVQLDYLDVLNKIDALSRRTGKSERAAEFALVQSEYDFDLALAMLSGKKVVKPKPKLVSSVSELRVVTSESVSDESGGSGSGSGAAAAIVTPAPRPMLRRYVARRPAVPRMVDLVLIPQERNNWCWAAVSMMMRKKFLPADRLFTYERTAPSSGGSAQTRFVRRTGSARDAMGALRLIGLNYQSSGEGTAMDEADIRAEINAGRPFIFASAQHYYVCNGYSGSDESFMIHYFNPLPIYQGRRGTMTYADYVELIEAGDHLGGQGDNYYGFSVRG